MDRIAAHRLFFSELVTAGALVPTPDRRVTAAFAATPRENFVGPGPWRVFTGAGQVTTPSDDPAFLYQDIAIVLQERGMINNGQPSLHAKCLVNLRINPGERVVHIGAGTGYYTALLSELAGPGGAVVAYEVEPEIAQRASENLGSYANVTINHRSGAIPPLPDADVIYVNAGASDPLELWLDSLRPGGRLLFPLTSEQLVGGMLLITRMDGHYSARFLSTAGFIPCVGARNPATAIRVAEAFRNGGTEKVRTLHRNNNPDATVWCHGEGWWLSTKPPEAV
jgi:protein-L-isoaspartate(D-aspartate) O-methyltransferase